MLTTVNHLFFNNNKKSSAMDQELKQTQSLTPEDYYEDNRQEEVEAIQNDNIAVLESQKAIDEDSDTPPSQPPTPPMTPAKKSRKSTGSKGKQPMKKQKLTFEEEEGDEANTEDTSTSPGK